MDTAGRSDTRNISPPADILNGRCPPNPLNAEQTQVVNAPEIRCPLEDAAGLAGFQAGASEVLAAVYRHHLPRVARVLRHGTLVLRGAAGGRRVPGLVNLHDVEAACHDVFLKAFAPAARAAFDGSRPFGPYLLRIARNTLVDHYRSQGRLSFDVELPEAVVEEDPMASMHDERLKAAVQVFVAAQPDPDGPWYLLRFREGRTQEDAANAMGLTRIQGRRIEARLREGLQRHLRRSGFLEESR